LAAMQLTAKGPSNARASQRSAVNSSV